MRRALLMFVFCFSFVSIAQAAPEVRRAPLVEPFVVCFQLYNKFNFRWHVKKIHVMYGHVSILESWVLKPAQTNSGGSNGYTLVKGDIRTFEDFITICNGERRT